MPVWSEKLRAGHTCWQRENSVIVAQDEAKITKIDSGDRRMDEPSGQQNLIKIIML